MACVAGVRDVETGKVGSRYLKHEAGGAVGNDGVGQSGNTLIWQSVALRRLPWHGP